ncbi:hypothetical protein SDC9_136867 [bioreactor metagenome]|uniref:Bacterial Pleckstrin homology domain-containing protein n=1 Tax=bioreactor metagenome TaxID=1076179 RepID=A0A645DKG4_9ZZZZ
MMLCGISLSNLIVSRWEIPRILVQSAIYLSIAIAALYLYHFHLVSFRYTLTDESFAIERIAGDRQKTIASIYLDDICEIGVTRPRRGQMPRIMNASVSSKESIWIMVSEKDMHMIGYRVSPSNEFLEKLTLQHQIAQTQKDQ